MVREQIDTVDALMAHYVAGSLPEPARVLVAAHLEMKPDNRLMVHDLDRLAGAALELVSPSAISDRAGRLSAIFGSPSPLPDLPQLSEEAKGAVLPKAVRDFLGFDVADVPWRTKLPGLKEYSLGDIDGCEVSLMWIRAGRALPAHTHRGVELTLVIDGAYTDIRGRFGPGDISIADDSLDHRPIVEKDGPCIAFAVTDAPIKLTGSLTQLIGDLIG
ncbi:transcriptional regulator [Rhizobium tubonense]|uniref:Transcriptional regulator n=2 Tax=Rhizobium tubonense TaxID=484088 RepID=A0A2W4CDA9_9HYPH|nr:transcriptional regulator [Rhizobium tubonense]